MELIELSSYISDIDLSMLIIGILLSFIPWGIGMIVVLFKKILRSS